MTCLFLIAPFTPFCHSECQRRISNLNNILIIFSGSPAPISTVVENGQNFVKNYHKNLKIGAG